MRNAANAAPVPKADVAIQLIHRPDQAGPL